MQNNSEEWFPLIDPEGVVIGKATRRECHSGSKLLHPVVHLHILNSRGELFLQRRSMSKDIQPGRWDTAVGGHVDYGEEVEDALVREVREELGIVSFSPIFAFRYIFESEVEREQVNSYYTLYEGEMVIDPVEISEGRYWSMEKIRSNLGKGIFTPNFEQEFDRLVAAQIMPQ